MNNLYETLSADNKKRVDDFIYNLAVKQIPIEDEELANDEIEDIEEYLRNKQKGLKQ